MKKHVEEIKIPKLSDDVCHIKVTPQRMQPSSLDLKKHLKKLAACFICKSILK